MAIWGIGAYHDQTTDMTPRFLQQSSVWIGWGRGAAPALLQMLDSVKIGDIIYIKAFIPRSKRLKIKAVGIVSGIKQNGKNTGDTELEVIWKKGFQEETLLLSNKHFRNNVYNNTLYEEYSPEIAKKLIDELIK